MSTHFDDEHDAHDGHDERIGDALRRRRAAAITAGVAILALAGTGGVLAAAGGGGQGGGEAAAPARTGMSSVASVQAAPAAVSGKKVAALLIAMLPQGTTSGVTARGTASGYPYAHVVFDDGHGPAAVEVGVSRAGAAEPPCPAQDAPGTSCTRTRVAGGTLTLRKSYEYPDHRNGTKDWTATFELSSGASVEVSEWNAPAEKDQSTSRTDPPLGAARLTAIVTDRRWQKVIDATPEWPKAAGLTSGN